MAYRIRYGKEARRSWRIGLILGFGALAVGFAMIGQGRQALVELCRQMLLEAGYVP